MTSGVPGPESVSDHAETPPDRPQTSQGHSSGPLTRNMTPAQAPGPATARETREPGENAKNAKNSKNAHSAHTHASAHDGKRVRRIFPWLQVTSRTCSCSSACSVTVSGGPGTVSGASGSAGAGHGPRGGGGHGPEIEFVESDRGGREPPRNGLRHGFSSVCAMFGVWLSVCVQCRVCAADFTRCGRFT